MNPEARFDTHIKNNSYPGRGLVIGRTSADNGWHLVYWIMGRSNHSRNRKFVVEGETLRTEPIDTSLVADPKLIIYEAMLDLPNTYLVSNGDQTRTIYDTLVAGGTFVGALATREREPDAPNYTPRISGMLRPDADAPITLSILKAKRLDASQTDRFTYRPVRPDAGVGYCLTTYMGDGKPLPSFSGVPFTMPMVGSTMDVLNFYWTGLDEDNKISVAVKTVLDDGTVSLEMRNKYL